MPTTATAEQIEQRIVEALETFGAPGEMIKREAAFEDLDVDSLDLVELSEIVQDEYGVKVTNDDVAQLRTVGDAIDLVIARAA